MKFHRMIALARNGKGLGTPPHRGWIALSLMIALAGCPSDKKPSSKQTKSLPLAQQPAQPAPAELMAQLGLRHPKRTLATLLTLVNQLSPLPITADQLLALVFARAQLPHRLLAALDLDRPLWVVRLDASALMEREPMVMLLPIRSRKAMEQALAGAFVAQGRDGDLALYRARGGGTGGLQMRLWIGEHFVALPSSSKAFAVARGYLLTTLMRRVPRHDVEFRLMTKRLMQDRKAVDRTVELALAKLNKRNKAPGLERLARTLISLLKTSERAGVDVQLRAQQGEVQLWLEQGSTTGELARQIKRQDVGAPFASRLVPPNSYFLYASRGPGTIFEGPSLVEFAASILPMAMKPGHAQGFTTAVKTLRSHLGPHLTLALHPQGATGASKLQPKAAAAVKGLWGLPIALTLYAPAGETRRTMLGIKGLLAALGAWISAESRAEGIRRPERHYRFKREVIAGGKGERLSFLLPAQKGVPSPPKQRARETSVAYLVDAGILIVALGQHAGNEAERALAQWKKKIPTTPPQSSLKTALELEDCSGLIYLSPIALLRAADPNTLPGLAAMIADAKNRSAESAPLIGWGVDPGRQRLELQFKIPVEQLIPLKPLFNILASRPGP